MIQDDILKLVRAAREEYTRSHDFDVYRIGADLRRMDAAGKRKVERLAPRRPEGFNTSNDPLPVAETFPSHTPQPDCT